MSLEQKWLRIAEDGDDGDDTTGRIGWGEGRRARWDGQAWEKGEMGCTHFFWMTPHASCPSESHERAGWDGRRKRLGLAGATGCPGKGRAPQAAARGGTGCPGEEISFARFSKNEKLVP